VHFNVNFNAFFKLIKAHLLVSKLYSDLWYLIRITGLHVQSGANTHILLKPLTNSRTLHVLRRQRGRHYFLTFYLATLSIVTSSVRQLLGRSVHSIKKHRSFSSC
jgi:hypothetical protein